jgi:hypothetical protein
MITKNINGVSYWRIKTFVSTADNIEIYLYGYINQNDDDHIKLFIINCPVTVIENISNYDNLISQLENYITTNVSEFQN